MVRSKAGIVAGTLLGTFLGYQVAHARDDEFKLRFRDAIDIVSNYQIEHVMISPVEMPDEKYFFHLGVTEYEKKTINVNPIANQEFRRLSTLHELYHALFNDRGVHKQSETQIDSLARQAYKELYGHDFKEPDNVKDVIDRKYLK